MGRASGAVSQAVSCFGAWGVDNAIPENIKALGLGPQAPGPNLAKKEH